MDVSLRQFVRRRAENRCEYCRLRQDQAPFSVFQIEHIIAKKHGGADEPENLALACDRCNLHKGSNLSGIDPETRSVATLYHLRTQQWGEHFELRGAVIVRRTSTGRATVEVCRFNAPQRLQLRSELLAQRDFP